MFHAALPQPFTHAPLLRACTVGIEIAVSHTTAHLNLYTTLEGGATCNLFYRGETLEPR